MKLDKKSKSGKETNSSSVKKGGCGCGCKGSATEVDEMDIIVSE